MTTNRIKNVWLVFYQYPMVLTYLANVQVVDFEIRGLKVAVGVNAKHCRLKLLKALNLKIHYLYLRKILV